MQDICIFCKNVSLFHLKTQKRLHTPKQHTNKNDTGAKLPSVLILSFSIMETLRGRTLYIL